MTTNPHRMRLACLVLSVAASLGCAVTEESPGTEAPEAPDPAELRRFVEAPHERPEVGVLRTGGGYCTGTLIGPRTVITAAHCFHFASSVVAASAPPLGTFDIQTPGRTTRFTFHRARADATVLQTHFDIAVVQLDTAVPATLARPAAIAARWPSTRAMVTVYGYGSYGAGCAQQDVGYVKRRTSVRANFPLVRATSCPGDSGGPYFAPDSDEIVAVVKGDGLGLEWVGDVVRHRAWVLDLLAASERGELTLD